MKLVHMLKGMLLQRGRGESARFSELVDGSVEGLQLQTAAHQGTWHLGDEERWDFSEDTGELVLTFPEVTARAPAQIVGTFDSHAGTWMWAWANPTVTGEMRGASLRVREYGEKHRIECLTLAQWPAQELDCWRMTAFANRLCESNGAYCGPSGSTYIFMTFGAVSLTRRQ